MQAIIADQLISVESSVDSRRSVHNQLSNAGLGAWALCLTTVLGAYHLASDQDFSFLMTLSSLISVLGMGMLCLQLASSGSAAGISRRTVGLHTLAFFCRFLSTFFHEGYLPLDRSGDFVYRGAELMSLIACMVSLWYMHAPLETSYEAAKDSLNPAWIAVPAFILALIVHPTLNNTLWSDVAWTFALYVDVLAVVPQLWMFHKAGGTVATCTSHYVFALGFGRVLQLLFWVFSYHELTGLAGVFVLAAQVIGALCMGDFFYYYAKSQQSGKKMVLPTTYELV